MKRARSEGKANRAFKFRLYPNTEQEALLAKTFGCVRFVFNRMLKQRIEHYEQTRETLQNTPAQLKGEFPWLKEVDSLALVGAQNNLDVAFRNFFRGLKDGRSIGFPRFKRKTGQNSYTTCCVNGNIRLIGNRLKLPKLEGIRVRVHREVPSHYTLKSVTVSRTASGQYFAAILYEFTEVSQEPVVPQEFLGLDCSMAELYVDSNNYRPKYARLFRKNEARLAREQRKLSRMVKGSSNYYRQKRRVASIHEQIARQRKDFLHQESRRITNSSDAVAVEDLNLQALAQTLNLGKSVADLGFGMLRGFLSYKLKEQGKHLVVIDRWFPSTKQCSRCGSVKEEIILSERLYRCDHCGLELDRDHNAAINICDKGRSTFLQAG